jgi:Flp pilus assembly pilin Flp
MHSRSVGAGLPLRDERGLTLTELAVTLALLLLVMVGVTGAWGKAQEAYFVGTESAELQQKGMKIVPVPDKQPFIEKMRPVWAQFERQIGKDLIEEAVNTK